MYARHNIYFLFHFYTNNTHFLFHFYTNNTYILAYLSSRHGKVSKYAILFVLVAGVGLEALALAIVPELERVVQSRRQDVFPIGGELNERYGRVIVVDERFEALP